MKIKIGDNLKSLRKQYDKYGISNLPTFIVTPHGHWFNVIEYGKKEKVADEYYICVDDLIDGSITRIERDLNKFVDHEMSDNNMDEILKNNKLP